MFELTLRKDGRVLVVHCSTRETKWLRYIAGKRDPRTGRPKGYRVEFAPDDTIDFDCEGRPWHDEKSSVRQWSLVPRGMPPAKRAEQERGRLGMVPDLERAREAIKEDRDRAEAQVPALKSGSLVMRDKTRNDLGLPKAPKHAAQVPLFETRDAIDRGRERRSAARAR